MKLFTFPTVLAIMSSAAMAETSLKDETEERRELTYSYRYGGHGSRGGSSAAPGGYGAVSYTHLTLPTTPYV